MDSKDREGYPPRTRLCDDEDSFSSFKRDEAMIIRAEERAELRGKMRNHHPIFAQEETSDVDSYSRYKRWEAVAARIAERKLKAEEGQTKSLRSWSPRHSFHRSADLRRDAAVQQLNSPGKQEATDYRKRHVHTGLRHTGNILHSLPSPSIVPKRPKGDNRRSTEESVCELISGIKHCRVEADEMIDLKSGNKINPFLAKDVEKKHPSRSPVRETVRSEPSSKLSPRHWHSKPLSSNPKTPPGRPALILKCSSSRKRDARRSSEWKCSTAAEVEALATAAEEEEVALPSPPPPLISAESPYKPLPPIPEISPLKEEDLLAAGTSSAGPQRPRLSTTALANHTRYSSQHSSPLSSPTKSRRRSKSSPLHSAILSDPGWHSTPSPVYLHGPIRLPTRATDSDPAPEGRRSSVGTIDWTSFQNAISGPTGDYLIGGESPDTGSATQEMTTWFDDFGFGNEGRILTAEDNIAPDNETPHELPAEEVKRRYRESRVIENATEAQTSSSESSSNDSTKNSRSWLRLSRESSREEDERRNGNLSDSADHLVYESKGAEPLTPST